MSQRNVERVIGRLVTDEGFRRHFAEDPFSVIDDLKPCGVELTPCEVEALLALDARLLERLADAIDPRLQKTDLERGAR